MRALYAIVFLLFGSKVRLGLGIELARIAQQQVSALFLCFLFLSLFVVLFGEKL